MLQMRKSALFDDAKSLDFSEIYCVSARTRGVEPVQAFCGQGEGGQIFAILCGRPLWTAPK